MTQVAFIIDPIHSLNIKKDSTLAMIWAAQRLDWQIFIAEPSGLAWNKGNTWIHASSFWLDKAPDELAKQPSVILTSDPPGWQEASAFDVIFMRKDPPFDMDYINATYLLEQAEHEGCLVVNDPRSLRDCNEKFFTTSFSDLIPPQIVTANSKELVAFHEEQQDVVFKPLDGMGGKGIFHVGPEDANIHVIIETLTNYGRTAIVGQKYLPEIADGDKRVLIIDGEPIPYLLARIPPDGEARGNLAVGGVGEPRELGKSERAIASAMASELKERKLLFTGIDVIGGYLTEVNVTCPTCIRELDRAYDLDIGMDLMGCVVKHLSHR